MSIRAIPKAVLQRCSMPEPDIFSRGVPSRLPEAYKKFFREWIAPASPVHYEPEEGKWKRDPLTGEVWPVQNIPIEPRYPKEFHQGLWGGEGCIMGYKKPSKNIYRQRVTKWWMPTLQRSAVYSEILDKRLSVIVTKRTINLIIDHNGFDQYILETADNDLKSLLALKLKKKMLLALFDKTLYKEDPAKQEKIYNKYKHHLENYAREDLEWYALSIGEAVHKLQEQEDSVKSHPLKHQFRAELIEELEMLAASDELKDVIEETKGKSWISKMNPFSKKT